MRSLLAWLFMAGAALAGGDRAPEELERLVVQDCGSCHGLTLKGGLGPDIRPQSLAHYDAEVLREVILDGIPETAMPPWRPLLTEMEADWIANYLLKGERP
ncbi:c-type cytochrome [Jhaorihella thermophila]|uniref:Cytochrome c55X n=1 Tax=Jhaorihella thermophila TaxID=488547 RepID=A0A1H5X8G5_9RHOB|nr:cytochrome c55X [Jhaorihella thermophila]